MSARIAPIRTAKLILCLFALAGTSTAFAADTTVTPQQNAPSKEQREKMASMHEQMAACLRSDKSVSECRKAMMKSCHDMMGKDRCSKMMGMGGMMNKGSGISMHDQMSPPADAAAQK